MFALHAALRRRLRIAARDLPVVVVFAVLGVALFYWAYFQAVRTGGAALASILLYTAPAWVAVSSALWLHERFTPRKLVAMMLTLLGVALISSSVGDARASASVAAISWGLVSGLAYAGYYLFGKLYFTRYEAATLLAAALPMGALVLLPVVPFAEKGARDWLVLAFVAVVPTYVAYLLYSLALARIEATRAATAATAEPVAAALLAYLVWGEVLRPAGYLGGLLVLVGVVIVATERVAAGRAIRHRG